MKISRLLTVFFAMLCIGFTAISANKSSANTTEFAYPLEPYIVHDGYADFAADRGSGVYHLGDDAILPAGTPAYAVTDGIVKHIGTHSRFGTVVLIEHNLRDEGYVVGVYGHLKSNTTVKEGQRVSPGQTIGFLGTQEENGGWIPHIHFGFRKGKYQSKWVYWGMGSKDELVNWHDPTKIFDKYIGKPIVVNPNDPHAYDDALIITAPGFGGSTHVRNIHKDGRPFTELGFIANSGSKSGADVDIADVDKDGELEIIVGAGPGDKPYVKIFDRKTQTLEREFYAYNESFRGGVRVSAGDLNGDGYMEIGTAPGPGGGAHIRVFSHTGKVIHGKLFPFGGEYRTGADIALGDITGDGKAEIIASNGPGESADIRYYSPDGKLSPIKIEAYPRAFKGGSHIDVADIDDDGVGEILAGAGPGGGPQIRVFEADGNPKAIQFFPFHPNFRGGIDVSPIDFDGDGKDEILTSQFSNGQAWIKVYRFNNAHTIHSEFVAYRLGFEGGANVAGVH